MAILNVSVIVPTPTYFYDTILYYHSRNHHPILIAIDIATLILQSAKVLGKIKKDRIIEMGIWANVLGTIEDKINFAAIPANNRYASNERTEIARAGATKILDTTISQLQTHQKGRYLELALANFSVYYYLNRFVFARSTISSPRPFKTALII
jgi:hypothetical protein